VARLVFGPLTALRLFPLAGDAAQIPLRALKVRLDTAALVTKAHALGKVVHYWVINDPGEAERLLALGADGIVTDDVGAIAPVVVKARRLRE
jgi:glycerophosphoryl diester phosphodiesterase